MSSIANEELEDFRRKWQEEVQRRRNTTPTAPGSKDPIGRRSISKVSSRNSRQAAPTRSNNPLVDEDASFGTYDFDDMEAREAAKKAESGRTLRSESTSNQAPVSALDHYELAVVRETEGKLGESLDLYRKAFRLDDCVDQIYKRKYFPASAFKPKPVEIIPASSNGKTKENLRAGSTVSALVASFAESPILGALPTISGDIPPPCPMKNLPGELLVEIFDHVAQLDLAASPPLAQVSRRFAYLVATQESIWKRLVHGPRFGLGGMHYSFSQEISGARLELSLADLTLNPSPRVPRILPVTLPLTATYPTYRHMLQYRPRIRFSGVYISTVNYTRPGANGPNALTWSTPIHVVTYYRYLRFYRDGSCISLLTTTEPLDVVPHLQKENIGGEIVSTTTLPVGVMRDARRGRWRLTAPHELANHDTKQSHTTSVSASDITTNNHHSDKHQPSSTATTTTTTTPAPTPAPLTPSDSVSSTATGLVSEPEGILSIETEGPTETYQYSARFEMQSAGGSKNSGTSLSARNTKLVWRGFWSHNLITGDWAEFGLRNDRAFVWSRVRSWADA